MSSPRLLRKLGRTRTIRVLMLGQAGVGKTAMTVRFITRRFIGEYDPTLEQKYTFQTEMEGEGLTFEIFDTAGQESEGMRVEENIRWADAFILLYSTTDRCSFDECTRLRFLINYAKKPRRVGSSGQLSPADIPVFLVGNKNDLEYDRMVSCEEGLDRSHELLCAGFLDISVRESYEQTLAVFHDIYKACRMEKKSRLSRSISVLLGEDSPPEVPKPSSKEESDTPSGLRRKTSVSKRLMRRMMYGSSRSRDSESSKDDT